MVVINWEQNTKDWEINFNKRPGDLDVLLEHRVMDNSHVAEVTYH